MIRRPPRSTHCISSAASDVYKRQIKGKKAIDDKPYSFCLNNLCSTNAQCNPTSAAYTCKCNKGYFGSGFSCVPTNCPPGTVQLGEACVKDKCTHCKPRFACRNENAGTPSAQCKCKEGWSGNGKLCLPKKNVARSDINAFADAPATAPPAVQPTASVSYTHLTLPTICSV